MLPSSIVLSSDVLFQELEGQAILLNLVNETYYGLDDVGSRIWQLLNEYNGETELVLHRMLVEYDVDEESLRTDMINLLADLTKAKLITLNQ